MKKPCKKIKIRLLREQDYDVYSPSGPSGRSGLSAKEKKQLEKIDAKLGLGGENPDITHVPPQFDDEEAYREVLAQAKANPETPWYFSVDPFGVLEPGSSIEFGYDPDAQLSSPGTHGVLRPRDALGEPQYLPFSPWDPEFSILPTADTFRGFGGGWNPLTPGEVGGVRSPFGHPRTAAPYVIGIPPSMESTRLSGRDMPHIPVPKTGDWAHGAGTETDRAAALKRLAAVERAEKTARALGVQKPPRTTLDPMIGGRPTRQEPYKKEEVWYWGPDYTAEVGFKGGPTGAKRHPSEAEKSIPRYVYSPTPDEQPYLEISVEEFEKKHGHHPRTPKGRKIMHDLKGKNLYVTSDSGTPLAPHGFDEPGRFWNATWARRMRKDLEGRIVGVYPEKSGPKAGQPIIIPPKIKDIIRVPNPNYIPPGTPLPYIPPLPADDKTHPLSRYKQSAADTILRAQDRLINEVEEAHEPYSDEYIEQLTERAKDDSLDLWEIYNKIKEKESNNKH